MKHVFVVNPVAGKGKHLKRMLTSIEEYANNKELDYEIYITTEIKSTSDYVRSLAKAGTPIRFYACGGDGTLSEVVNGACEYDNAEVASVPIGSGNDFIRLFGTREQFMDLDAQVNGTAIKFDLIKCRGKMAINQCSMGLDAEVCAKQQYFKKLPFLNPETAYSVAVVYCFFKKMNHDFVISIDDDPPIKKKVLFCLAANSRWYGGGYKGAPYAIPDDGLIDVVIVEKDISRWKLFKLIGRYKAGDHLGLDLTTFKRAKKVTVRSEKPAAVNIDGECEYVTKSTFELFESAINFVIPSSSTYIEDRKSGRISQVK